MLPYAIMGIAVFLIKIPALSSAAHSRNIPLSAISRCVFFTSIGTFFYHHQFHTLSCIPFNCLGGIAIIKNDSAANANSNSATVGGDIGNVMLRKMILSISNEIERIRYRIL